MKAKKLLREIEKKAQNQHIPLIGPKKGQVLVDSIKKHDAKNILEVGTNIGYSAILMASELDEEAKITTIEVDPDIARRARENFKKANLQNKITVRIGPALKVIPTLSEIYDMLFLDAVKEEYIDYLKLSEPKLKKGAVVVADNVGVFRNQLLDYLKYVKNDPMYESKTVKFEEDAVEVSVKKK